MEGILSRITRVALGAQIQKKETTAAEERRLQLLEQIRETGKEMAAVRSRFDLETNFDLIDAYILEMESLEKRYGYLIKEAKQAKIAAF